MVARHRMETCCATVQFGAYLKQPLENSRTRIFAANNHVAGTR
jgi:hypothetical protein